MILLAAQSAAQQAALQAAAAASAANMPPPAPSPPPFLSPQPHQQHLLQHQQQQQWQGETQQQQQQLAASSAGPQPQGSRGSGGGGISNMFKIDARKSGTESFPSLFTTASGPAGPTLSGSTGSAGLRNTSSTPFPSNMQMLADHVRLALQGTTQMQPPGLLNHHQQQQSGLMPVAGLSLAGGSTSADFIPFVQGPSMHTQLKQEQGQLTHSSPQIMMGADHLHQLMDHDAFRNSSIPMGFSTGL